MKNTFLNRPLATILLAALTLVSLPAFAGSVEDVHEAEERRYKAMIDMNPEALADSLADEFFYHQPNGKSNDKEGYIKQMMTGAVKIFSAERYDVKVNVYGDVATAMGGTRLDIELGGERRKTDLRYLNVWLKRDGRWQLAKRQSAFKQ
ncbi:MAG TPA: nuclear transport factor 2 family protein [Burkholderiales bacterium]|nr:nuclear transport factor 2 family protein [Burkholderiales bacterium]